MINTRRSQSIEIDIGNQLIQSISITDWYRLKPVIDNNRTHRKKLSSIVIDWRNRKESRFRYHNSPVEPLFHGDEKITKLLLLLHVLLLINIYGAKVITSVLLDCFLFLAYSAIYYYVSFLMQLITEIIKALILLYILLHIYGVTIARQEGCTALLNPQLPLLLLWAALKLKIDKKTKLFVIVLVSLVWACWYLQDYCISTIEWLNKTIKTTSCQCLTCKNW